MHPLASSMALTTPRARGKVDLFARFMRSRLLSYPMLDIPGAIDQSNAAFLLAGQKTSGNAVHQSNFSHIKDDRPRGLSNVFNEAIDFLDRFGFDAPGEGQCPGAGGIRPHRDIEHGAMPPIRPDRPRRAPAPVLRRHGPANDRGTSRQPVWCTK